VEQIGVRGLIVACTGEKSCRADRRATRSEHNNYQVLITAD
jgi:hypothetical protein